MKKVGKYLSITLLLLTGLFFVCLLFLFFVPNSSIFGITFISYNERKISNSYEISEVNKIVLNSRSYDIEIESTNSSSISARIENHSLGYVLKKNSQLILKEDFTNGVLTFTITEPYGVAFKNDSKIKLLIPNQEVDLKIENKNASFVIDNSKINIRNFTYKAEKGVIDLNKVNITGNIDLDLNKTNLYISSDANLNNCDVDLKLTSGKFDSSKSNIGSLNILSNDRGVILLNNCLSISQTLNTTGGRIEANQVGTITFTGSDTNLYINEILTRASISLKKSGNVEITKISGIADIVTEDGNIEIKNCTNDLTTLSALSKGDGNITIKNAYNKVFTETNSGNIKITFAPDADKVSADNKNARYLKAITSSGKIVANSVNSADVEIKENGSAEIIFEHFDKDLNIVSTITSNSGDVYVKVKSESSFILNSSTKLGNSRINLIQTEKFKGWTEKEIKNKAINCSSSSNIININITGSGNILMHDDKVN